MALPRRTRAADVQSSGSSPLVGGAHQPPREGQVIEAVYDNDQLDYLCRVRDRRTNHVEEWAWRDGLVSYWDATPLGPAILILTLKGEHVVSHKWADQPRQKISSEGVPLVAPPQEPLIPVELPYVKVEPAEEPST